MSNTCRCGGLLGCDSRGCPHREQFEGRDDQPAGRPPMGEFGVNFSHFVDVGEEEAADPIALTDTDHPGVATAPDPTLNSPNEQGDPARNAGGTMDTTNVAEATTIAAITSGIQNIDNAISNVAVVAVAAGANPAGTQNVNGLVAGPAPLQPPLLPDVNPESNDVDLWMIQRIINRAVQAAQRLTPQQIRALTPVIMNLLSRTRDTILGWLRLR